MSILTIGTVHSKSKNWLMIDSQIIGKVDSLVQKYQTASDKKTAAHIAFQLGEYYWFRREIPEAEQWFLTSLENENEPNNINDVVNANALLAHLYHHIGEFEKSEDYANQAQNKIAKITNKRLLGNIYEVKGRIYHSLGESESSFKYFLMADSANISSIYPEIRKLSVYVKLIIADIFKDQSQYTKSKEYLDGAYCTALEYKDQTLINVCQESLARWYIADGKLDEARRIYLELLNDETRPSATLYSNQGLGEIEFLEKNYSQAIVRFSKAVDIAKKTNELYMLDVFYHEMAKTYFAKNDLTKSKIYLDSCIQHKGSNLSNKLMAYELKSEILEAQKDYKGALEALRVKNIIQDSLNRQNLATLTNQLDAANRTKEKDSKIRSLEYDKMVAADINLKNDVIKYLLFVIILILAMFFYIIYAQMKKRKLLEKEAAIQEQQNRISADLHDDIGSTLSSISVYSELASKFHAASPDKSKDLVDKISIQSTELMSRIEDIIWSLKPKSDERFSFENKIRNIAIEQLSPKNIQVDFQIDQEVERKLNEPRIRKNVLLIIKEAIQNIAQHSHADQAKIILAQDSDNITIKMIDNGKGFDDQKLISTNGLKNMKWRAENINGSLSIFANDQQGTTITCTIPIARIREV
jgi:signal transduction histidine kinase